MNWDAVDHSPGSNRNQLEHAPQDVSEQLILHHGEEMDDLVDGHSLNGDQYIRWERIVTSLLESTEELGWHRIQSSFVNLPDEIISIYDFLENECGYPPLQHRERKSYYHAFFKKASGFAVINALQMEELLQEQIDIGDMNVRDMMYNLPVNNGLFDFKSFISLLSEIILNNELIAQRNKVACWKYWYHRLIPIHPDAFLKQAWDVMILWLLVYSSFQVPYSMAFDDASSNKQSAKYASDMLLDIIFMIDVALCFVSAFYDAKGMLVVELREISSRYCKTWFLPDLGGSFPFDTVISVFLDSAGNIGAMRILKLVRLLKLIRAVRVFHKLGELGHKEGFAWLRSTVGVTRSLFLIVFCAHALGCFFYLAFVPNNATNWMYTYRPDLQSAANWPRYVTAVYWAVISITTMGYGDVVPVTHEERIFCIVVALIGAVVFSFCMGTITKLVTSVTGAEYRVAEKLQHATEYLLFREHSNPLKRLLKSFYNLSWRKSGELFKEREILGEIPTSLRKAVLAEIGEREKKRVPMFQGFDDECIGHIFTLLCRVDFIAGDVIYRHGDPAAEMFLVTGGTASIHYDRRHLRRGSEQNLRRASQAPAKGTRAKQIEVGGAFGELALFPDLVPPVRAETAVADSWVVAYTLPAAAMPSLEARYPNVVSRLREYCELKLADGRARGHSFVMMDKSFMMGRGSLDSMLQPCKLNAMIVQMQRDLLLVKEQSGLLPAAGDFGSQGRKVLKLMIYVDKTDDDNDEGEGGRLISSSCVLSDGGELLFIEHTTAGITADGLKSLGWVIPEGSHRELDSEELLRRVGPDARRRVGQVGSAQLFGCCFTVRRRGFETSTATSAGLGVSLASEREVLICTWIEEDLESLIEILDGWHASYVSRLSRRGTAQGRFRTFGLNQKNSASSKEFTCRTEQKSWQQRIQNHSLSGIERMPTTKRGWQSEPQLGGLSRSWTTRPPVSRLMGADLDTHTSSEPLDHHADSSESDVREEPALRAPSKSTKGPHFETGAFSADCMRFLGADDVLTHVEWLSFLLSLSLSLSLLTVTPVPISHALPPSTSRAKA